MNCSRQEVRLTVLPASEVEFKIAPKLKDIGRRDFSPCPDLDINF